jgi:hypothetical protein
MQAGIIQVYQLTEGSLLTCVALPQRHITNPMDSTIAFPILSGLFIDPSPHTLAPLI